HAYEILPTPGNPSQDVRARHGMSALADPSGNPPQGELRGAQAKVHNLDPVASALRGVQLPGVGQTAQRRFERKVSPFGREPIDFPKDQPASRNSGQRRVKWRKALGDQVGIDELDQARDLRQVFAGEGRLACTIGAGNHDAARLRWSVHEAPAEYRKIRGGRL